MAGRKLRPIFSRRPGANTGSKAAIESARAFRDGRHVLPPVDDPGKQPVACAGA